MLQPQPQRILRALAQSLSAQQSQTGAGQAQSRCSRHDLLIIAMCSTAGVMPLTDQRAESLGAIHFNESHPRAPCTSLAETPFAGFLLVCLSLMVGSVGVAAGAGRTKVARLQSIY